MGNGKKALIVVGSPKGKISTSNTLATFLAGKLGERLMDAQLQYLAISRNSDEAYEHLLISMGDADILAFVFPLYADQLPSGLVETLERYAEYRVGQTAPKNQAMMAVVNCGFPEAAHNDAALAVLKRFAELERLQWLGGLSLGGGGIVADDKPLEAQGGRVRHVARALELASSAVEKGQALPAEAERLMHKSVIPRFLYRWMANWGFKYEAKKWGLSKQQLAASPFSKAS